MPDALLPDEVVEALVAERRPRFVALDGSELASSSSSPAQPGHGGVVQLRLSNGIKVGGCCQGTAAGKRLSWAVGQVPLRGWQQQ